MVQAFVVFTRVAQFLAVYGSVSCRNWLRRHCRNWLNSLYRSHVFIGIIVLVSSGNNRSTQHVSQPPQTSMQTSVPVQQPTPEPTPAPTPEPTPEPTPAPIIETGIVIEYDDNLFLYKYDVRISVNDNPIGIIEQGGIEFFELSLTEEIHAILFSEFGNDENITTDTFEVVANKYNFFFIKARSSGIEIEKRDTMTNEEILLLVGSSDDVIDTTPTPTPTPEPVEQNLTISNSAEFANLFSARFPSSTTIQTFVDNNTGRTIEFDGFIFLSWRSMHGWPQLGTTSRYVDIRACDFDDDDGFEYSPSFIMKGVSTSSFPVIRNEDINVHVIAKIVGAENIYLDDNVTVIETIIILEPISLTPSLLPTPTPSTTPSPTPSATPTTSPRSDRADWDTYNDLMDLLITFHDGNIIEFKTGYREDYSIIHVIVSDAWYHSETHIKERFVEAVSKDINQISKDTGVKDFVSVHFFDIANKKLAEPKLFGGHRILR